MSRTITLRLDQSRYDVFKKLAVMENRPLSNFIETATQRYIDAIEYADEFEMKEIHGNKKVNEGLKKGMADYKAGRGRFL